MSPRPSVLLLPGSFARPDLYDKFRDSALARGVDITIFSLPSVRLGSEDSRTPPSMYDDATAIARAIEKLADEGKDVIVISHSYSGVPMTQATPGLSKESRKQQGKSGGLVRVAYMTSLVPGIGQCAGEIVGTVAPENAQELGVDEKGWMFSVDYERTGNLVFNDLPEAERLPWAKKLLGHSPQAFQDPVTQAGYLDKDLPVSYLLCENDLCIPPAVQIACIKKIESSTDKTVSVTKVATDHTPVVGQPEVVVGWVVQLVDGTEQPTNGY